MDLRLLDVTYQKLDTLDESFSPDPMGYFILHKTSRGIRCEHYTPDDMPTQVITCGDGIPLARQAESIRKAILKQYPTIDMSHYGYLCQELGKLQSSIDYELPYTQD